MSRIALAIGHSRSGDSGAVNTDGVTEHKFNSKIARLTGDILSKLGHTVRVIGHYEGSGYSAAMSWLAKEIKAFKADVAVELHFNSAGPYAEGHEWLCWHRSSNGYRLASSFDAIFSKQFPELKRRGVKLVDSEARGSLFLRMTHCPAAILEPYFGSNQDETEFFSNNESELAQVYADAIHAYCSTK